MKLHFGFAVILALVVTAATEAAAGCTVGDFICEKFAKKDKEREAARKKRVRRTEPAQPRRTASRPEPATPVVPKAEIRLQPQGAPIKTSMIVATPPVIEVTPLQPGSISAAPKDLPSLSFSTGELMELATAQCQPIEGADRNIRCQVAIHQLAVTSAAGAGCTGSLGLRELEFARNDQGAWINEDSISLCGGRLLRRAELFPVAVNGEPAMPCAKRIRCSAAMRHAQHPT